MSKKERSNMKIEVLGTGCKRCDQLYENALNAVSGVDRASDINIEKIGDINYFTKMGVFMTPGLVIDGKVISTGKVPSPNEIKKKIEERL
jgi:small redox-active disulfide protein 2